MDEAEQLAEENDVVMFVDITPVCQWTEE